MDKDKPIGDSLGDQWLVCIFSSLPQNVDNEGNILCLPISHQLYKRITALGLTLPVQSLTARGLLYPPFFSFHPKFPQKTREDERLLLVSVFCVWLWPVQPSVATLLSHGLQTQNKSSREEKARQEATDGQTHRRRK